MAKMRTRRTGETKKYVKPRESRNPAHYRGWTLVERLYARYAIKGTDAVRVCPLGGAEKQVIEAFRRKVDELEGSSC